MFCAGNASLAGYAFDAIDWQIPGFFIDSDMRFYSEEEWTDICGKTFEEMFDDNERVINDDPIPVKELDAFKDKPELSVTKEKSI